MRISTDFKHSDRISCRSEGQGLLPALALAMEPAEGEVMKWPPRNPQEGIFAHGLGVFCIWMGLLMAALCIGLQYLELPMGNDRWETMVFTVVVWGQLTMALAVRSEKESLFKLGFSPTRPCWGQLPRESCCSSQ